MTTLENRHKDQHGYLLRMKKKLADATFQPVSVERIESIEFKLSEDYLETIISEKT